MATFVQLAPDPFASVFAAATTMGRNAVDAGPNTSNFLGEFSHVRRPLRGIQIKRDTYCTIEVRTSSGQAMPLTDTGSLRDQPYSRRYSNFLAQNVNEGREEKTQVVLTFGEPYIFFYGEQPRILQVSGALLNSEDFQWRAEWWQNYDTLLRGTKCVENRARVYMSWDDVLVEGYLLNCNAQETAENRNFVGFTFSMFLTNYTSIANLATTTFPGTQGESEINLDPNTIDVEGMGNLQSDSLAVRQLNLENAMASSASLMGFIRAGLTALTTVNDAFMDLMQAASQFLGGRMVRVPIGYGGSAAFDDLQLAQASVPGLSSTGTVLISGKLDNRAFYITGGVGKRWEGGTPRGSINLNTDEYVSQTPDMYRGPAAPVDLFLSQKADDSQMQSKVAAVFAAFGVSVAPPSDLLILAGRAAFAMMNIMSPAGGTPGYATSMGQFGL